VRPLTLEPDAGNAAVGKFQNQVPPDFFIAMEVKDA